MVVLNRLVTADTADVLFVPITRRETRGFKKIHLGI